jgi:hypothetical protein
MSKEEGSFLDKLDQRVNSRNSGGFNDVRTRLSKAELPDFAWQKSEKAEKTKIDFSKVNTETPKKAFSVVSLGFFVFAFVLFLGSLAYALYSFQFGSRSVRQDNIDLTLNIPSFTNSGQEINGELKIANKNQVEFLQAVAVVDVKTDNEVTQNVSQFTLGTVASGQELSKNLNFTLNGREGDVKTVQATLFYKVSENEQTIQKVLTKEIKITKSPVIVNFSGPKTISLGQVARYTVSVRGGSGTTPGVGIRLALPQDLNILETSITPKGKNFFDLGPLKEGEEKVLTFSAEFKERVELAENFTLKATVGISGEDDITDILAENSLGVNLKPTPFTIAFSTDNETGINLFFSGKTSKVKVVVTNASTDKIKNAILNIKLSGGLLNSRAVSVSGAQYDAGQNLIKATAETNKDLEEILPGEKVEFVIEFKDTNSTNMNASRKILLDATFTADVPDSTASPATVRSRLTLLPKDNTLLGLSTLYFSGPFKNEGPVPPKIGVKTTYTMIANVETLGGFTGGVYTITLPEYVEYVESNDKSVSYRKDKREVVWAVGDMKKSTGDILTVNKKEIAIQVSIVPSPDQLRLSPALTKAVKFEAVGLDKVRILSDVANVNVNFYTDPKYEFSKSYGAVVE